MSRLLGKTPFLAVSRLPLAAAFAVGALLVLGCAGPVTATPSVGSPVAAPAPVAAEPERAPPVLGALLAADRFEGAGCGCTAPSGRGSAFLDDGSYTAMHIDGQDWDLVQVSDENKPKARITRYTAGDYNIQMRWKEVGATEGGASYDVKLRLSQGEGPPLEVTLSCGCGC